MFIDEIQIELISGRGGDGLKHFKRERGTPKGGPDGGDGGRGGHIILKASHHLHTLYDIHHKPRMKAEHGGHGQPYRKKDKDAQDIMIEVPMGTYIFDRSTGLKLCELLEHDATFIVCKGGKGGLGNNQFKTSQNRAPNKFTLGEAGQSKKVRMELKLLADCGLVGLPNAGKSSLVKALSNATPRVGDFPFTTLKPSLGIVSLAPGSSFTLADIPGIIKGAAQGKGLGNRFLRHIERSACLAFVISIEEKDPFQIFLNLISELQEFQSDMILRPKIVVINKSDLKKDSLSQIKPDPQFKKAGCEVVYTSTISKEGLENFKHKLWPLLKITKPEHGW